MSTGIVGPERGTPPYLLLRQWKPWMSMGLAGVVLLAAGAVRLVAAQRGPAIPASDLYAVGYGNVSQTIQVAGTIEANRQVALSFLESGKVAQVDVKVGQHVKAGQVLARLDDSTIRPQVAQAQAAVAVAQANLQKLYQPATPQQVAAAQAKVAQAQAALAGAEQAYRDAEAAYNDPSLKQNVVAEQNQVNQAAAALKVAQANVAAARVALQQAEAGVATSALNTLPKTIQADQTALAQAQAQLAVDQNTLDTAEKTLAADQARLKTDEATYGTLASQYQQDQAYYQQVLKEYQNGAGYPTNPYANALQEAAAVAQEAATAYNTIQSDQHTVLQDQSELDAAQNAVHNDEVAIKADEANLANAQNQLAQLQQSNPLTVQAAQAALAQAEAGLNQAQANYQGAEASLSLAQQIYNSRIAAKSSLDQAQSNVAQAQDAVTTAEDEVSALVAPPTPAELAAAQGQLQSAQAQLQAAQANENNTVLKAPIDGVVVAVNGTAGSNPPANEPMVVLDDSVTTDLQVNFAISQAQRGAVRPGEPVSVTVSAYPGQRFAGTVVQVYPTPQVVNNVTEFTVVAVVKNPHGLLAPGMNAEVTVETQAAHHVLVVPSEAVQHLDGRTGVYLFGSPPKSLPASWRPLPNVYFQPVTLGLAADNRTAVVRGLSAGQRVVLVLPRG